MNWKPVELKKDSVIRFRCTKTEKELFYEWCNIRGTNPTDELRKFILNLISNN